MSEPRRSTRARAREEAAPVPETPQEKPARGAKTTSKRKRTSVAVKESTPSTPVAEGAPLPPKQTLPLRLVEGAPLPTLVEPQPLDLPPSEWQNIQQSGVLEASLERSRAVWMSGVNFRTFHTHFTPPKKMAERTDEDKIKVQKQKELIRNFPQLGAEHTEVKLIIEPHTFLIRLYGPREAVKTAKKTTHSPYGSWPNHNQPNQHTQYNTGQPIHQKPPPRPPPPKPVQAAPPPAAPSTPAPDPVIHMLAARAGTDPELKAVMKVVAAGQATKDQLEFFQTHISELTAILERQKAEKAPKVLPPPPAPKPLPPPPAPKAIAPPPLPRPVQPAQPQYQNVPKPYSPNPMQGPMQPGPILPAPPMQQTQPYTNNFSKPPQYHHQQQQQVSNYNTPPRTTYRPLVFSFVNGNEDRFYFPSYSFMEWLPNGKGAKLSFLITKMKPKPDPVAKPPSTPAPKPAEPPTPGPGPNATPGATPSNAITPTPNPTNPALTNIQPAPASAPTPLTPHVPQPTQRIEDFDEMNDIDNIEFYQPITVLMEFENEEIIRDLPRSIRPPHVVEKYMNAVFDRCKRADETYLAFRLPKDGDEPPEKRVRSGEGTPAVATPTQDVTMGGFGVGMSVGEKEKKKAGRPRKSLA